MERIVQTSGRALRLWELQQQHHGAPLFSGGVVDGWPHWALQALRIIREELGAVRALEQREERAKPKQRR